MKLFPMLIRIIGAISLALSFWGFYYLAEAMRRVLIYSIQDSDAPLFRYVFWAMTAVNALFLLTMALTSISLLRLKRNAVRIYTWLYIALAVYVFAPGLFWGSGPLGRSIAAASGVGALGVVPLTLFPIPFLYAVASVILVNLAAKKIGDTLHPQAV